MTDKQFKKLMKRFEGRKENPINTNWAEKMKNAQLINLGPNTRGIFIVKSVGAE